MSTNNCDYRGEFLTLPAPAAANSGVGPDANDPLVIGRGTSPSFGLAAVAQTSYTQPSGLVPTGNISYAFIGVFFLSVNANNGQLYPGDRVYATGGTYDSVTGVLYGFTLTNTATNDCYYGNALDGLGSGLTATIRVRLKVSG
jgi:hypothetical protein